MARVLHLFNVLGAPTESVWLEYATGLAHSGHDVSCAYESASELAGECPLSSVKVRRIEVDADTDPWTQMGKVAATSVDPVLDQLRQEGFDLIHGHLGTRILHGAAWLARGTPMVVSLYGYDCSRLLQQPGWAARYRWVADHGGVFVVLHASMRDRLIAHGLPSAQVREIPLGIRPDRWPFDPQPAHSSARFVFVGRLVPKKGLGVLLQAMSALRDHHHISARLDVVGDGPLRGSVETQISEFGLDGQVRLLGARPRESIPAALRAATAMVLPSVTAPDGDCEGTPIVLMEAQALGIPCITTQHAGNADLIASANRFLVVPENDAQALAQVMAKVVRLPAASYRSVQEAGRRWIETRFDLRLTIERYQQLYLELLQKPDTPTR